MEALRSLTYVSTAIQPVTGERLMQMEIVSARLNALDGITGMLVHNGSHFCQTIEGASSAIEHLMMRIKRDPRHHEIIVTKNRVIAARTFGSWAMRAFASVEAGRGRHAERVRQHFADADPARLFWAA